MPVLENYKTIEKTVRMVNVEAKCPDCETGFLRRAWEVPAGSVFLHRCSACGVEHYLDGIYPHLDQRELDS